MKILAERGAMIPEKARKMGMWSVVFVERFDHELV